MAANTATVASDAAARTSDRRNGLCRVSAPQRTVPEDGKGREVEELGSFARRRSRRPPTPQPELCRSTKSSAVPGYLVWVSRGGHVEHMADICPFVQVLDAPVPQMGNQLLEVFRHLDSALLEQVIDVPKISHYSIEQRYVDRVLRHPQMVEQLVEVPTVLSPSLLRHSAAEFRSKSLTFPVRSGGLQG